MVEPKKRKAVRKGKPKVNLLPGERTLITKLRAGEACRFNPEESDEATDQKRTLRGDILGKVLRAEKIDGVSKLTLPRQVIISGALIEGELNMSDTCTGMTLTIKNCQFDTKLDFRRAEFAYLNFENCDMVGARLNNVKIASNLWLNGIHIKGELSLASAVIGGQLCVSRSDRQACLQNQGGDAISAQHTKIALDVFLQGSKIEGVANFNSSEIGGQFLSEGASFISIITEKSEDSEESKDALDLEEARIEGHFFLHTLKHPPIGNVNLTCAKLEAIGIDKESYPLGLLFLQGTQYERLFFIGEKHNKVSDGWLRPPPRMGEFIESIAYPKGTLNAFTALLENTKLQKGNFYHNAVNIINTNLAELKKYQSPPFAYRQFAKVSDANGHEREARDIRVLAAKAFTERTVKALYPHWQSKPAKVLRWGLRQLYRLWRYILRKTTGYGEHLQYAAYWLLALLSVGTICFWLNTPEMVPAKEVFYMSEAYATYVSKGTLPDSYPKFNPFFYSLDVMLPIVDIAQESHWRPKNVDSWWNGPRNYNRFHLLSGWFLSTIGIAGLTGLLKDRRE